MRIFEFLLLIMMLCTCAWGMQTMVTKTGVGYYTYNGQIISDYQFVPGSYPLCDGLTYTDVDNQNMLNAQQVNFNASIDFKKNVGCH